MAKCIKKDFIIFSLIGFVMTILNFLLLALFVELLSLNYILSNILSYLIAVIVSYFANSLITFNHKIMDKKEEFLKVINYCIMKLTLLGIDTILLYLLVDKFKINLYISKIVLTILLTVFSFVLSKKIIKGGNLNEKS